MERVVWPTVVRKGFYCIVIGKRRDTGQKAAVRSVLEPGSGLGWEQHTQPCKRPGRRALREDT